MSEQDSTQQTAGNQRKTSLLFASAVLVALIVVVAYVIAQQGKNETLPASAPVDVIVPEPEFKPLQPKVVEPAPIKPDVAKPVTLPEPEEKQSIPAPVEPQAPIKAPLPKLNDSDAPVIEKLQANVSAQAIKLLANDDLIRRSVVFIDNLARGDIAKKHSPVLAPQEKFKALEGDIIIIDPNSYERYTPYVNLLSRFSGAQLVRMYTEFEPLFIEAYQEIGYEGDKFEGTLKTAIQELIDTPVPSSPLPLIKDSVTYKYAATEWEQLSDAQKQFLRMGPENMEKVKVTLKALQKALNEQ
ncbi:hypothetical protein PALB_4830 [Pseudoalteromonas luteoviolacea B = ATCC 29581]|nr:hypothetical protein PALB_4830 [Pseudoalteromonas luteoviolacea B = ATCC 29581]